MVRRGGKRGIMSDIQSLLINRIREALEKLQSENVGYINVECTSGFQYIIDGRPFAIDVKELGQEKL